LTNTVLLFNFPNFSQGESSSIENMALLHITVLLHQGSLVFHDEVTKKNNFYTFIIIKFLDGYSVHRDVHFLILDTEYGIKFE